MENVLYGCLSHRWKRPIIWLHAEIRRHERETVYYLLYMVRNYTREKVSA